MQYSRYLNHEHDQFYTNQLFVPEDGLPRETSQHQALIEALLNTHVPMGAIKVKTLMIDLESFVAESSVEVCFPPCFLLLVFYTPFVLPITFACHCSLLK